MIGPDHEGSIALLTLVTALADYLFAMEGVASSKPPDLSPKDHAQDLLPWLLVSSVAAFEALPFAHIQLLPPAVPGEFFQP